LQEQSGRNSDGQNRLLGRGRQGFRRIEAGPDHSNTGSSTSRPANQLGFNDLKAIEVAGYLEAIAERPADPFNLAAGLHGQTLVETIRDSSRAAARRDVS
jgi:hypothetical protein